MSWKSLGIQTRFMIFAALGALTLAAAVVVTVCFAEYRSMESRLRALSVNELASLNALVETAMQQRLEDRDDVAIKVFNAWFESRNKNYQGQLWSVWSPKVVAFVVQTYPDHAVKKARDEIDEEVMRTGRPIARFVGDAYRYSVPIILGHPLSAPKETCLACHGELMGLTEGEPIAVFSSSIAAGGDIAELYALLWRIGAGGFAVGLGVVAFTWWVLSSIVIWPLNGIVGAMRRLAGGDMSVDFASHGRRDEIGEMQSAVLVFRDAAREKARLEKQAAENSAQKQRDCAAADLAQRQAIENEREVVNASIGAALAELAGKTLSYRISDNIPAAYRRLKENFNCAMGELQHALGEVAAATTGIGQETRVIATATDDLSRRTEQQAASLEQTTAALSEISASVKRAAEGATHAREVVESTAAGSQQSQRLVHDAIAAMDSIASTSKKIGSIIHVIDEIAFQTNLLALNAGVEAARAGDSGRGFAVVASEVRALAQRSGAAAQEIKQLITAAGTEVDHGVRLVRDTGAALERTVSQVAAINAIVAEIADGATRQAAALSEINAAIGELDRTTQGNAGVAEQTNASTQTLSAESERLTDLVADFRLDAAPARAARAA
jgi:methyl-accepting chemotaxis protein